MAHSNVSLVYAALRDAANTHPILLLSKRCLLLDYSGETGSITHCVMMTNHCRSQSSEQSKQALQLSVSAGCRVFLPSTPQPASSAAVFTYCSSHVNSSSEFVIYTRFSPTLTCRPAVGTHAIFIRRSCFRWSPISIHLWLPPIWFYARVSP